MRVNVLISTVDGKASSELLVLPYGPLSGIPGHLKHHDWRNLATTATDDRLLHQSSQMIEDCISKVGYALVPSSAEAQR